MGLLENLAMQYMQKSISGKIAENCPADLKEQVLHVVNDKQSFKAMADLAKQGKLTEGLSISAIESLPIPPAIVSLLKSQPAVLDYINESVAAIFAKSS